MNEEDVIIRTNHPLIGLSGKIRDDVTEKQYESISLYKNKNRDTSSVRSVRYTSKDRYRTGTEYPVWVMFGGKFFEYEAPLEWVELDDPLKKALAVYHYRKGEWKTNEQ